METESQFEERKGLWYALGCYGVWGLFPLFWYPLNHSAMPATQILAHRIAWSAVFAVILLLAFKQGRVVVQAVKQPKLLGAFTLSSLLIAANWLIYLWAILNGHLLEASLGYFINPLVNVLLGRVVFKERLNPAQVGAVVLAVLGILWLAIPAGQIPWISLLLAGTFGFYGLVRKIAPMPPLAGLTLETLLLLPLALGFLVWCGMNGSFYFAELTALQLCILVLSGVATTVPLLMFAAGAKRIPLSLLGILQYVSPTMQLILGLLVFGETMNMGKLVGYGLVWAGVLVFLFGAWQQYQNRHAA
ncbi:EamA family transporter RarD [Kingella negevensis]|uniref:EamA family transporter RarD n=1 Tax=Kingella negevensis TaxID=1522312 RepID=UPI002543EDFA|nr:EamA family transporter RarD [Kingella negevensis]WII93112.1 EamA family transporter RarD [Kingella negevensis]